MSTDSPFERLQNIIKEKNTNIILSCDVTTMADLCYFADLCGPYICVLKVHTDIIEDFSVEMMLNIKNIAKVHRFLLMEDRKFGDIGHTLSRQLTGFFKYLFCVFLISCKDLKIIVEALTTGGFTD